MRRMSRGYRGEKRNKEKGSLDAGIFNLSSATFSVEELKVLELSLKYAPSKSVDKFRTFIDLHKFISKINIKKHFASIINDAQPTDTSFENCALRNKSTFNPKHSSKQCLDVFKMMVKHDIEAINIHPMKGNKQIKQGIRKE